MSIKDKEGNLHSEINGRFIPKNANTYQQSRDMKYLTVEEIGRMMEYNKKPDEVLHHLIDVGAVNLNIKWGLQNKHIEGTKNYQQEIERGRNPSILTVDPEDLIRRKAGTGSVVLSHCETWYNRETISDNKQIGFVVDEKTGERRNTNSATIHYSNDGVHVVPRKDGK